MRSAARRSRSASSPSTANVIRPAARRRRVRLDEEPGVLVDLPEHLVPDPTVRRSSEKPRVPIDADVDIRHRHTGEEVDDAAHLRLGNRPGLPPSLLSRPDLLPEGQPVPLMILHGELSLTPRSFRQRIDDPRACRYQPGVECGEI
jgi:hypothetical protein